MSARLITGGCVAFWLVCSAVVAVHAPGHSVWQVVLAVVFLLIGLGGLLDLLRPAKGDDGPDDDPEPQPDPQPDGGEALTVDALTSVWATSPAPLEEVAR